MTNRKIWEGLLLSDAGSLMHGSTFMANPLACAVANASIDLLLGSDWQSKVASIEKQLIEELRPCKNAPSVKDVRVYGAIGVVELNAPIPMSSAIQFLMNSGVWLHPFKNLIYTIPPYIISKDELSKVTTIIHNFVRTPAIIN